MNAKYDWVFNDKTTLADVERTLRRHRLRIHSMTFDGSEFRVKLQGRSRFYFGFGSSMASAMTSVLDDFGQDMIATYARSN